MRRRLGIVIASDSGAIQTKANALPPGHARMEPACEQAVGFAAQVWIASLSLAMTIGARVARAGGNLARTPSRGRPATA